MLKFQQILDKYRFCQSHKKYELSSNPYCVAQQEVHISPSREERNLNSGLSLLCGFSDRGTYLLKSSMGTDNTLLTS